MIDTLVSTTELSVLLSEVVVKPSQGSDPAYVGRPRVRKPVMELAETGQALCDSMMMRVLALLETELPALVPNLFGDLLVARETCLGHQSLHFSPGEPAVNIYTMGGGFKIHEDRQSRAPAVIQPTHLLCAHEIKVVL